MRLLERSAATRVLEDAITYVWWIDLQVNPEMVDRVLRLLSRDEQSRADRFANYDAHREFVITRFVVRLLLAHGDMDHGF
jgi:phosphopantetheinyl transferase